MVNGLSENRLYLILITGLLLTAAGWFLTTQYQKTITFVIPSGTAQQLELGNEVVTFPNELTLNVGDIIVIENQDDAVHTFGPFTILPHTTLTKRFNTAKIYQNSCTFHQNQQMTLVIDEASRSIFQ